MWDIGHVDKLMTLTSEHFGWTTRGLEWESGEQPVPDNAIVVSEQIGVMVQPTEG